MSHTINLSNNDHTKSELFLDINGGVGITRTDVVKYPKILKTQERMRSLFWTPEEIDLSKDYRDFKEMEEHEKHIFTSNLKRQILLDTIQGRSISSCLLPCISVPEMELAVNTVAFFEDIHSSSYTHIIKNVYPNAGEVFDTVLDIPEIVECSNSISEVYDALHLMNCKMEVQSDDYDLYEHKRALWRFLIAWNALEALRFYVSFACSWAFGKMRKMVGNSSIISLIARDEEGHCMLSKTAINILRKEDGDFKKISEELKGESTQIYLDVIEQEKEWAKYLFKEGAMIGLNESILCDYIEWLSVKRMGSVGLTSPYKGVITSNPLPWTESWINTKGTQAAPQETENTKYLIGALKPDLGSVDFDMFELDNILNPRKRKPKKVDYIVYGRDDCSFCDKAKELLTDKEASFDFIYVDDKFTKDDLIKTLGVEVSTVPQIVKDGVLIGGYNDLIKTLDLT